MNMLQMVTLERIPALDQLEVINHIGTRATVGIK